MGNEAEVLSYRTRTYNGDIRILSNIFCRPHQRHGHFHAPVAANMGSQKSICRLDTGQCSVQYVCLCASGGVSVYAHLPPAIVLHVFTGFICLLGIASLNYALKTHNISPADRKLWVIASAFLLFVPTCMLGVFADREHLLFAFGLPWILQMLLGLETARPYGFSIWNRMLHAPA